MIFGNVPLRSRTEPPPDCLRTSAAQPLSPLGLTSSPQPRSQSRDASVRCVFLWSKSPCPGAREWSQTALRGKMLIWSSWGYKRSGRCGPYSHTQARQKMLNHIHFFKNSFQKHLPPLAFVCLCTPRKAHNTEPTSTAHQGKYSHRSCDIAIDTDIW